MARSGCAKLAKTPSPLWLISWPSCRAIKPRSVWSCQRSTSLQASSPIASTSAVDFTMSVNMNGRVIGSPAAGAAEGGAGAGKGRVGRAQLEHAALGIVASLIRGRQAHTGLGLFVRRLNITPVGERVTEISDGALGIAFGQGDGRAG